MSKTGLKTFAYSFSVSLFAIFAANGVYWHATPKTENQLKIPHKNVVLFLRSEPINSSGLANPVKKISLNVLPEIVSKSPENTEIIMADNSDFDVLDMPDYEIIERTTENSADIDVFDMAQTTPSTNNPVYSPKFDEVPVRQTAPTPLPDKQRAVIDEDLFIPVEIQRFAESDVAPEHLIVEQKQQSYKNTDIAQLLVPLEKNINANHHENIKIKINTPNDLNQVALVDSTIPVGSMEHKTTDTPSDNGKTEKETSPMKKDQEDSPWLVAKAKGIPKNKKIEEATSYSAEMPPQKVENTQKANTTKNLLIPIPEEILNAENLTPKLSISPTITPKPEKASETSENKKPEGVTKNILSSLENIFSSTQKNDKPLKDAPIKNKQITLKKSSIPLSGKIMPVEMRLSFQPNRAEISGQTLRWVQAFATKVADSDNLSIEIRIDGGSATELQQKRLNLLHNILANKGVQYSKINTVFTQREPNSFILRTLTHNNQGVNGNSNKAPTTYYQQW